MTARLLTLLGEEDNRFYAVHQWADGTFSPLLHVGGNPTDWYASWKVGKRGAQWAMVRHRTAQAAERQLEGFRDHVEACLAQVVEMRETAPDIVEVEYVTDGTRQLRRIGWLGPNE